MDKIVIIHFQPLEKYPPITNLLDTLAENDEFKKKVYVFTSDYDKKTFAPFVPVNDKIIIKRLPAQNSSSAIVKLLNYFIFYFHCFFKLVLLKPTSVLYYETLSVLPAYLYSIFNKKLQIFIHYHEYTSPKEYNTGQKLVKYLHKFEQKLYNTAVWVSHTNNKRLQLFLQDENLKLNENKYQILPNFPPKKWKMNEKKVKTDKQTLKFVYIGALSLETMYVKEFASWLLQQNGRAVWDIYTNQSNDSTTNYIANLNSDSIKLKGSVDYQRIPDIVNEHEYEVGLILYKGHIPNYVHNAPNKLFEYLACGLEVWFPDVMEGCKEYAGEFVKEINFNHIDNSFLNQSLQAQTKQFASPYYCENVYQAILKRL